MLVAYGTKNGSTAEIAEHIAAELTKAGCATTLRPAAEAAPLVGEQDAVVLGGALYAGRWHRDARRLARRAARELAARPLWLFSSGPLDPSASERDIAPVPGVRRIERRTRARDHVTFGGHLDEHARGRMAQAIVKNGKGGDFRDFERIAAWARGIAAELTR
ncbi:flavodoxin domain-containing protein [Streptomyces sp. BYX5S]